MLVVAGLARQFVTSNNDIEKLIVMYIGDGQIKYDTALTFSPEKFDSKYKGDSSIQILVDAYVNNHIRGKREIFPVDVRNILARYLSKGVKVHLPDSTFARQVKVATKRLEYVDSVILDLNEEKELEYVDSVILDLNEEKVMKLRHYFESGLEKFLKSQ